MLMFFLPTVAALQAPGSSRVRARALASTATAPAEALGMWAPVASIAALSGLGPQKVELFGRPYAVWEHEGAWSVLLDQCPHRLAPLSQGRVDGSTGCLECPYHGWQFERSGACASIPQAPALPSSEKINVASVPTVRTGDLLWGWFDESVTGERGSPEDRPEVLYPWLVGAEERGVTFFTRELCYSFDVLVENFMDPAHIPFAHHGLQGVRGDGSPIPMARVAMNETHVEASFEDVIRGKAREGVVSFRRPARYHFRTKREMGGFETNLEIYAAPVRAGRTRVFFASPLGSARIPTWLSHAASNRFLNTDIWLHDAERNLRSDARGDGAYVTPTSSDVGANAWRVWWRKYGMADAPDHSFGPAQVHQLPRLSRAETIDAWEVHTKHCASCRQWRRSRTLRGRRARPTRWTRSTSRTSRPSSSPPATPWTSRA